MSNPGGAAGPWQIDLFGGTSLATVMLLRAFNQVLIKHTNEGLQPAFAAGLRWAMAALCVGLWMRLCGRPPGLQTAAGVPPMCDEPADFKTFRIGLLGLDKLTDVAGAVARLEAALDQLRVTQVLANAA